MKMLRILFAASMLSGSLLADTLELANGSLLEGELVGLSNGILMFNTGTGIEAFPQDQVVAIFFSSGVATAQAEAAAPQSAVVTVPEGTRLVIRTRRPFMPRESAWESSASTMKCRWFESTVH